MNPNGLLIVAALLSAIAALLHIGIVCFGLSWYRFFGAGNRMVRLAEMGSWYPTLITLAIAAVLSTWALYALPSAGITPQLPYEKLVLTLITTTYLLRGIAAIPVLAWQRKAVTPFWIWSSLICTAFGLVHLAGLCQQWAFL